MWLTKESKYAINTMVAIYNQDKMISTQELSELTGISKGTLFVVLSKLGRCKLVNAHRGAYGGYSKKEELVDTLSCYDIIVAIEGGVASRIDLGEKSILKNTLCDIEHILMDEYKSLMIKNL